MKHMALDAIPDLSDTQVIVFSRWDRGTESKQGPRDSLGKSPTSSGVVDWDGPDKEGAPPRDWSGWGKFPGADYLGIKRETKNKSPQQSNLPEAEGEKAAGKEQGVPKVAPPPDARGSEMKPGVQDRPDQVNHDHPPIDPK